MFAPLSRTDLSGSRFLDWRHGIVKAPNPDVASAAYVRRDRTLLILANLGRGRIKTSVVLNQYSLGLAKTHPYHVTDINTGRCRKTPAGQLIGKGWPVSIAPNSCVFLTIEPERTYQNRKKSDIVYLHPVRAISWEKRRR